MQIRKILQNFVFLSKKKIFKVTKYEFLCQNKKKNGLRFLICIGLAYLKAFLTKIRHQSNNALVLFINFPSEEGIVTSKEWRKSLKEKNGIFPLGKENIVKPLVYG